MNDFNSGIKKMQIRWRRHLSVKKLAIEQITSMWSKEIITLVEKQADYKAMGVNYNMDNLELIDYDLRMEIIRYLVDMQLLRFVDARYASYKAKADIKQEKMVKD